MSSEATPEYAPLDFGRVDHVPESQLETVRALHESFGRLFSESLGVYLRSEISAGQITVDQLPFADFARCLPFFTCLACFGIAPFHGCALLEVSPVLLAPILDHVMGGNGKLSSVLEREMTELEKEMLDDFFKLLAGNLTAAWKRLAPIRFEMESIETSAVSDRISPAESVVVTAMELRIGEHKGTLNFAMPVIALKALRPYFDQQGKPQKTAGRDSEKVLRRKLARRLQLHVECSLAGARLTLRDLLSLEPGQVLDLGVPIDSPVTAVLNGKPHFQGKLQVAGSKLALRVK